MHMEAFVDLYITSFYKTKVAQESKWPLAIKEQLVQTTDLYYKHIIRDESVPDDGHPLNVHCVVVFGPTQPCGKAWMG